MGRPGHARTGSRPHRRWRLVAAHRLGVGVALVAALADDFLAAVELLNPPSGMPLLDELAVSLGAEGTTPRAAFLRRPCTHSSILSYRSPPCHLRVLRPSSCESAWSR